MSAEQSIHMRLVSVLADVDAITKERVNEQQRFRFRGVDDVYNTLHPLFARHGIYVRPEVLDVRQSDRQTAKGGTQIHAVVKMRYHFTAADGSSVHMEMTGEAADSGDKSLGKAAQYAYKVLLLQAFLIPTEGDNDPDAQATEWAFRGGAGRRQQPEDAKMIAPWLQRITKATTAETLEAVRADLTAAVRSGLRLSSAQNQALRRAIETASQAHHQTPVESAAQ